MGKTIWMSIAVASLAACGGVGAQSGTSRAPASHDVATAHADLKNAQGRTVGTVKLMSTPHGVLLQAELDNLPAGEHAFHLHQTGRCDAPDFKTAGGHYAPRGHVHGFLDPKGPHAGDMPNLHVSGKLNIEYLLEHAVLDGGGVDALLDSDGAAVVVHAGKDDYRTDPAGDSGERIACGVIQKG